MSLQIYRIASVTVGAGGASSISFSSIPSNYTDLLLKVSCRSDLTSTNDYGFIQFNGDTANNYSYRQLQGDGSTVGSQNGTLNGALALRMSAASATAATFGSNDIYIPNYNSTTAKSVSNDGVSENNATQAVASLQASLWNPGTQTAITSIVIKPGSGNFVQYSTATLYGIL